MPARQTRQEKVKKMRNKILIFVLIVSFSLTLFPGIVNAQFGKNMVRYRNIDWKIYETPHFEIHFYIPNEEKLTPQQKKQYLASMYTWVETAYEKISTSIDYEMPLEVDNKTDKRKAHAKPRIFFFWNRRDASNHPLGPGSAIAYADPTQMRMVFVPNEYNFSEIQQIVTHEVCHLFQFSLWDLAEQSPSRLSRLWYRLLTFVFEGWSQHVSGLHKTKPSAQLIIRYFVIGKVLPYINVKDWTRPQLASLYEVCYILAGYLYDYIHTTYGDEIFEKFVKEFRRAKPTAHGFEKIIHQILKTDFVELDRGFRKYLEEQYEHFPIQKKEAYEFGRDILVQRDLKRKNKPEMIYDPVVSPDGEIIAGFIIEKRAVKLVLISRKTGVIIKKIGSYSLYKYGLGPVIDPTGPGRGLSFSDDSKTLLYFARTATKYPVLIKIDIVTAKVSTDMYELSLEDLEDKQEDKKATPDLDTSKKEPDTKFVIKVISKKVKKIKIRLDDPQSPELSADKKTIIFSAIDGRYRDIFSLNLETREIKNLTNENRFNYAPSLSPDEQTIIYVTNIHGFNKLFKLNLNTQEKTQLTFGPSNEIRPIYSQDGKTIWFISDQDADKTRNLYSLNIETGKIKQWTNVINGIATVTTTENEEVIFGAVGYRDSRHVFTNNVYEMDLEQVKPVDFANKLVTAKKIQPASKPELETDKIDLKKVENYNPWKNIYLEQAMLYATFDSYYGIYGYGYAYLTDLTRTKHIQASIWALGKIYQNNQISLFNLSPKVQWGVTLSKETSYFYPWYVNYGYSLHGKPRIDPVLYMLMYKRVKFSTIAQYPLDLCHRLEFSITGQSVKYLHPDWSMDSPIREEFLNRYINDGQFASFNFSLVRDTALYTRVGPFANDMYKLSLGWSTGGYNALISAEGRKYINLGLEWTLAFRGYAGAQWGKTINPWIIGDLGELRGYQWMQFMGNRIWIVNAEFRFPLIKNFNLLGIIYLGDIRAALFCDLAQIWFDERKFNVFNQDELNPSTVKGSVGVDLTLGTVPILGQPLHLSFAKRMRKVKFLPELEDDWQIKLYFGYSF